MQAALDNMQSPIFQLLVYSATLIFITLVSWFYAPVVIMGGVSLLSIWLLAGSIYGISPNISWYYFVQLAGSLLAGYLLLGLLSWMADEWGRGASGDGFMAILGRITMSPLIIFSALAIKGAWQFVRSFL